MKALWCRLGPPGARFARARALGWIALGVVAYPLGWWYSVAFVTMASLYANVESGFATAAGNDDTELKTELRAIRTELVDLRATIDRATARGIPGEDGQ